MQSVSVKFQKTRPGAHLPRYAHEGDAGFDLHFAGEEPVTLSPGMRRLMPTGLVFEIPDGYEIQVRPRSGWAVREGVTVLNSPGTIDAGYRGEVQVCLANLGHEPIHVRPGDRIAQGVVTPVWRAEFLQVESLAPSSRGDGGFGSTGR